MKRFHAPVSQGASVLPGRRVTQGERPAMEYHHGQTFLGRSGLCKGRALYWNHPNLETPTSLTYSGRFLLERSGMALVYRVLRRSESWHRRSDGDGRR